MQPLTLDDDDELGSFLYTSSSEDESEDDNNDKNDDNGNDDDDDADDDDDVICTDDSPVTHKSIRSSAQYVLLTDWLVARAGSGSCGFFVRIGPICFLAGCLNRRLNQV